VYLSVLSAVKANKRVHNSRLQCVATSPSHVKSARANIELYHYHARKIFTFK